MNNLQDESLEAKVLGSMMISPDDCMMALSILTTSEIFYSYEHRAIFESIRRQQEKDQKIDVISTVHDLKAHNLFENSGGTKKLGQLMSTSSAGYVEIHTRILVEMYMRRKAIELGQELITKASESDVDVFAQIASTQAQTENLVQIAVGGSEETFGVIISDTEKKWLRGASNGLSGHSTGMAELDRMCGGLTPGELTIVGARPGQGKTALVVSLIRNLCHQKIPCGIFSLEMSRHELAQRLASQESQVPAFKIKGGVLTDMEKDILRQTKERMQNWNIRIFDEGEMNLRKLRAKAIVWQRKHNIKVLFVDYLQLMSGVDNKRQNRENEISEISRGLKILARELNIPVVALSQLSRRVEERADRMPMLSDLRESGAIEQDADVVWFLMRPAYYKMSGDVEINGNRYNLDDVCIIDQAKMRSGSTGQIPLIFDGPLMRMRSYDRPVNQF
jgi:replicative DNA helicase